MRHQQQTVFENTVGKGEIAHDEQFLLFHQCFQCVVSLFGHIFEIIPFLAAELEEPKIGISVKGLNSSSVGTEHHPSTFEVILFNPLPDDKI